MTSPLVKELTQLPVEEKLQLLGALWETVDESEAPLHPAQIQEVRNRYGDMRSNPATGISLAELKSRLG